ncbi:DUF4279 domain-containing protein [Flavihumibacter profundi]|uniref:DUF4279 domain-containing protein n=1 Tax=Flavihumibacter profundi TaxID=2716883 RepID=UPI001CC540B0|nr:DUF4279 domain-containing protein [Flavihumibacter profundi]MBZ5858567.1 DUF4279 domain-containing protein [Flavihumibacter profundi]
MKNEINLSFCIWDFDDITHSEITRLVGLQPSKIYIKGENKNTIGSALVKENGWIINASLVKYSSFEDQMNYLLDIIEPKIDVFKSLCEKYYCEFSCAVFIRYGNGESTPWVHLNSRYNKLIKELNIEFDIDLYCLPNEE